MTGVPEKCVYGNQRVLRHYCSGCIIIEYTVIIHRAPFTFSANIFCLLLLKSEYGTPSANEDYALYMLILSLYCTLHFS